MNRMKYIVVAVQIAIVSFTAGAAFATESYKDLHTFSFYFENDIVARTDQAYTNGVKLTWVSPDLTSYAESENLPEWSLPLIEKIPFIHEPDLQRNIALSIGQNMYTPEDTARYDLVEDDRPYAGWTYFGIAFHNKNDRRLDSLEIQFGIIGPQSYADRTQRLVHEIKGVEISNGWDNQLKNEPGLAIIAERKYRVLRMEARNGLGSDTITHLGGAVGNVSIYANAGVETRLGLNVPVDFGTSLIRPAGDTSAPAGIGDPRSPGSLPYGIYLFGSVDGRAVIRDIFLDGNTFTDSHSVDRKNFVADISAGISVIFYQYKLSYAQVMRTKEFRGQEKEHWFGSVSLSFSY
jgi:lipid A 3-O-deacylase